MNCSRLYDHILIFIFFGITFTSSQPENDFYSESWALLIGINNYQNETQLNYAVADAMEMQRLLTEKLGFPEQNITLLLDNDATLQGIKNSMQELAGKTSENDRVLIYFGGHGFTQTLPSGGEEGYLIPIDGNSSELFSTSLPMSEMKRLSNMTPAKDMLFLMDACYSGLMGVGSRRLVLDETAPNYMQKIAAGGSRTIITAGRKGEEAQERAEWGHSPFVKNILSGLEKGMADTNGDGYIFDSELGQYLTYQVTVDTDNKQTPAVSHFTSDQGQFVFIIGEVDVKIENDAEDELSELKEQMRFQQEQMAKLTELMLAQAQQRQKIQEKEERETQPDSNEESELVEVIETQPNSKDGGGIVYSSDKLGVLEEEMEALDNEMEEVRNEMEGLGNEMEELQDEIDEAEDMEEGKEEAIKHLKSEMGRVGEEMGRLGREMGRLGTEMGRVGTEIEKIEEQKAESVNELIEKFKDLGIDIKSEEIAKISGGVGNKIKSKIGLAEGKLIANCAFANSQTRYYADEPEDEEDIVTTDDISNNNWWRYNRSEGLFFQLNGVFQSPNIKGSSFYGGVGRAFHRNEYQWILGLEQLIFNNVFQFYAEAFNKSITNDAWRLWDGENSLSTIFRRQDYLDWYHGRGYRAAGFVHIKNYVSIGAEYNQVAQSEMNNVLDGKNFRRAYHIEEGDNIFLKAIVSAGYPVEISVRDKFQMYTTIIRTSSMDNADMNYTHDHLYLNLLIPYAEKLNFNIKTMVGASDVDSSIWYTEGYYQNVFEIGGEGTLRGYDWKSLSSSHYQLTSVEVWFGFVGVFYDRAILFDSPGNVFNDTFFSDLSDNISQDVKSSMGFILGRKNFRLSFAKQITDNKNTTIYLTFGSPLQYW